MLFMTSMSHLTMEAQLILRAAEPAPPSKEITLLSITWHLRGWGTNISLEKSDSEEEMEV
jgi:hypothetical protein